MAWSWGRSASKRSTSQFCSSIHALPFFFLLRHQNDEGNQANVTGGQPVFARHGKRKGDLLAMAYGGGCWEEAGHILSLRCVGNDERNPAEVTGRRSPDDPPTG